METIKVAADRRNESGKGAASRLRSVGKIPAVAYGKQLPAQSLAVSPDALKAVYFGPDISPEALEIVCLLLAGQNSTVRLFRGQRSTTEFKVDFASFTYTPYLEAKRLGLRP